MVWNNIKDIFFHDSCFCLKIIEILSTKKNLLVHGKKAKQLICGKLNFNKNSEGNINFILIFSILFTQFQSLQHKTWTLKTFNDVVYNTLYPAFFTLFLCAKVRRYSFTSNLTKIILKSTLRRKKFNFENNT